MSESGYKIALDALGEMVRNAKSVPLSSSVVIPQSEALGLLEQLRDALPQETEHAREVLAERDELLAAARQEAQELVEQGKAERTKLLSKTELVQGANAEAHRIVSRAEADAEDLRRKADDYVDAKLARFEILLNKTLKTVHKGREQLRQRLERAEDMEPFNLEDSGEISAPVPPPATG